MVGIWGVLKYKGFVLGVVNRRDGTKQISKKTEKPKYAELYKLARALIRKHVPNFKYDSIQSNKSYRMAKHKDGRNVGQSYIVMSPC